MRAQVQLLAAKVQWLRWGLAHHPVLVAGGFCQTPGSLFTATFFNDQCVIGQPGQMKAQGFRVSVMGNLYYENPDQEGEFTQPTTI